ncbi:MAG TPA: hypothetical protein VGC66_16450 [Pyrinomonadaceae bacterium]|jgi:hypothetical protein
MRESVFESTIIKRVWALALLLCIAPFLVITLFVHPVYDDYCHAAATVEYGVRGAVRHMYLFWSGKYFSTTVLAFHPIAFGSFPAYKLVSIAIILLTFISVYFLVSVLLKREATVVEKLIAASFFTALFSNQMPELTEGYYWMPGSITYMLGVILTVFFFGSVVRLFDSRGISRRLWFLSCSLLIVAIVGSSETLMAIFFLLMLSITIKAFVCRDDSKWLWLWFLLLTTVCTLVVFMAPGNAVRSSRFAGGHRLFYSLLFSSAQEARFLLKWLSNPALILGTILFIPVAYRLSEKNELLKRHFKFHPFAGLLLLLAIVFLGFFPAYWSTGLLGQHRTVNLVFFLFLLGWFLNLTMWVSYLRRKFGWAVASLPIYVYVICLLLIPLSLLATNNTRETIEDLASGRAFRYDMQMKQRYLQIEQCLKVGQNPCPVNRLKELPTAITSDYMDKEVACDEKYWKLEFTLDPAK